MRPELEGGVEIVRRTLLELELPMREIQRYTDLVRREGMDESERPSAEQARVLHDIVSATRDLEIGWIEVGADSNLNGRRLADAGLREAAGVSVVGIGRGTTMLSNPGPETIFVAGDRVAVIGTAAEVAAAEGRFRTALPLLKSEGKS